MNNVKNICIAVMTILLVLCIYISPVYAETSSEDKQELIDMLNQYKNDLGDLNQVKTVVDQLYSDINSASTGDDNLKKTLTEDINMLDNVTGMNPLILTVLKSELSSQVEQLSDSNLSELKDEVAVIKEWVDTQVSGGSQGNTNTIGNTTSNTTSGTTNTNSTKTNTSGKNQTTKNTIQAKATQSLMALPNTGVGRAIIFVFTVLVIATVGSIIKYRTYKDVK